MMKKRVLLAGEADAVTTAKNFFSNRKKFSVMIAQDGQEAMRNIMEQKPDLVMLDIDLPKMGGDECCKAVKQAGCSPAPLIVLMVSADNHRDIGRCLDAECDAILPKPLRYDRLSGIVTRLLFMERHIFSRFPVRLPVRYGLHPRQLNDNYSVDLTTKGLFLEAEEVVPVGTPLQVAFTLPHDGTTIECFARVVWLNDPMRRRESLLPPGMGLEFLDIDHRQVDAIREFLYSDGRGLRA